MRYALSFPSLVVLCLFVQGCSRNPNVEVIGSYFPGWMISLFIGIGLTGVAHTVLRRLGMIDIAGHPALIYPAMLTLFTCLLWLVFFA
jgi:YtcA family